MKYCNGLIIFILFILFWKPELSLAIVGYDCGSSSTNISTISLLEVGECEIPQPKINVTKIYMQLLQINEYISTTVIQCKIEINRIIYHCGMNSHVSVVNNGQIEYLKDVSHETCQRMHLYRMTQIGQTIIGRLLPNQSTTHSILLAGFLNNDGYCNGGVYSDPYGSWSNVIVQGSAKITLQEYTAKIDLNANKIHLRSGTVCQLSEMNCVDIDGGNTFWKSIPLDRCKFDNYGVLYEGMANKILDDKIENSQVVYSLATEDVTFALKSKSKQMMCGYTLIQTEHPKLLIFETKRGETVISKQNPSIANLDIFAYVNSKLIYVERHIRTQVEQLYQNVLIQQCSLEQQMLKNALTIATQSPDEFAYHIMKGPGYMALASGEVVHIIKCIPVEVKIYRSEECYNQLPVSRGNQIYFLSPRTHIMMKTGTQITCNALVPPTYLLGNAWYKMMPQPVETIPPTILKPLVQPTWKYINPSSLATSGIYTESDLNRLRDHIMFPAERPAVLNSVARGIMGEPTINQGGSISNLLDEESLNKIAESAWKRTWSNFMKFGTASAGLIGLVVIFRGIKLIIDTIIHGYALHMVYGWSIYLIGAIWSSVTSLLLHISKPPNPPPNQPKQTLEKKNFNENISIEINTNEEIEERDPVPNSLYPNLKKEESTLEISPRQTIEENKQSHFSLKA